MTEPTKESRRDALELLNDEFGYYASSRNGPALTVLARTLDKLYNRTPVDPLLEEAREICAKWEEAEDSPAIVAAAYREGVWDSAPNMRRTLETLRRGMELAPKPRMPTETETREAMVRFHEFEGSTTLAKAIRAGGHAGHAQSFHTAITEMLEKINEREGV